MSPGCLRPRCLGAYAGQGNRCLGTYATPESRTENRRSEAQRFVLLSLVTITGASG
ncbi:hypothetical protein Ae406Ps2_6426c [Pseudonocardia sp. Ae406_Ps2]|nr:hypothetical protein Ae406Ps2_6426c [Pseudonocardia sp. Ae406_Ps2]